ncbi:hypothetical protein QOT17_017921 [Balamuthia mandrillaris]
MESSQETPSFMPPVGSHTLPLWTELLQTDDSLMMDILCTGFEHGFSSFEEAWEQLQQLSPSLLHTERLIHTNGWATSQEGFDGAFFITPFIIYTDEAVGGWQLSQLAPSPAFTPTPASSTSSSSSSSSIMSSSLESSQVSNALAHERAELS